MPVNSRRSRADSGEPASAMRAIRWATTCGTEMASSFARIARRFGVLRFMGKVCATAAGARVSRMPERGCGPDRTACGYPRGPHRFIHIIRLHYYPATAAMIPHIVLEELGATSERVLVDRTRDEHRQPAYLQL